MIDKKMELKVTNRDNGTVGYTIPDLGNLHRNFAPGETKTLTYEELEKLSWVPGGEYILKNNLKIDNEEVVAALLGIVEPEYYYSEDEVKILLSHEGSLDQLKDALQYAPTGVIELIKSIAVKEELSDVNKRKAILDATGFNVTSAIEINHAAKEEAAQKVVTEGRRANPVTANSAPQGRKTSPIIIKR